MSGDPALKHVAKYLAMVCLTSGLGCTALSPETPEEIVGARALEQADALKRGDHAVALTYMTPTYQSSPRAGDYQRNRAGAGSWQKIELKWVKCDLNYTICDVRLLIYALRPPAMNVPIPIALDDRWIKVGRDWYQYE